MRRKDQITSDLTFRTERQKVHEDCFGADSDDESGKKIDVQVFYKHMGEQEWTEDKGLLMKLVAQWEANGCQGAMANSGVSPIDWATDHSVATQQEEDYQKNFTAHVREMLASQRSSQFFQDHADKMPETFLEAVSAVRGPNAWQPPPPPAA